MVMGICPSDRGRLFVDAVSADGLVLAECGLGQVYVYDRLAGTTVLASRATGARGRVANDESLGDSISADGRFVAFDSSATNLTAGAHHDSDVFVRDLRTNTTRLASRLPGRRKPRAQLADGSMSADGRFVAFDAAIPRRRNFRVNVYVRDMRAGSATLVSRASGATGAKGKNDSEFRRSRLTLGGSHSSLLARI